MTILRAVSAAGLALFWLAVPAAATESEAAAQTTVDEALGELLAVLRNDALSSDQRLGSIAKIVYRRFDLRTFSRLVLGREWSSFSKQQQAQFVCEFEPYLSNYVGSRFDRYKPEAVEILDARDERRGDVTVSTRIVGGRFHHTALDYRMRKTDGEWRVIDVSFEGIHWASNLRAQFMEVLSRGGPEQVLEMLRKKNPASTACAGRSEGNLTPPGAAGPSSRGMADAEGSPDENEPRQQR